VGLPAPTPAQVRAAVGGGLEDAMARFVPKERLAEAMTLYRAYWHETMLDGVKAMPGARELLDAVAAREAKAGVLTNKLATSSRLICDHLGFTPFLGAVVGAGDTEWLKPEPRLTRHTLALLGAESNGALFVGDSPFDIATGHGVGIPCWVVTTGTHSGEQLRAEGADAIFEDLDAIRSALR